MPPLPERFIQISGEQWVAAHSGLSAQFDSPRDDRRAPGRKVAWVEGDMDELQNCLAGIDPGIGYDAWIRVGMAIHHETGGSEEGFDIWDAWSSDAPNYDSAEDLRPHWLTFRSNKDRPVGIGTLRGMSRARAEDFEDLTTEAADGSKCRFYLHSIDELKAQSPTKWLVKGVLPQAGLGVLYGETGSGKSFFVLDMIWHIAAGLRWRGLRVDQVRVVYVGAEGAGGFRNRTQALVAHYPKAASDELLLKVITDAPNFLQADDLEMSAEINRAGGADLIVVDTLAQTMPGANENASEDMGKVLGNLRRLTAATGAMVLVVHHAGKDLKRGARGWSGLKAAADFEMEISADGPRHQAKVTKLKDGEGGQVFSFTLKRIVLGTDEDGEDISSCVVEHANCFLAARPQAQGKWQVPILECLYQEPGGIERDALVSRVLAMVPEDAPTGPRDRRRDAIRLALRKLEETGHVEDLGDVVAIP